MCDDTGFISNTTCIKHPECVCTDRLPKTDSDREGLTSLVTGKRDQTPPKVILKLWPFLDASESHTESTTAVPASQQHELTPKSESLWVQHYHKSMENHSEYQLRSMWMEANRSWVILGVFVRVKGVLGCKSRFRPCFSLELSLVVPNTRHLVSTRMKFSRGGTGLCLWKPFPRTSRPQMCEGTAQDSLLPSALPSQPGEEKLLGNVCYCKSCKVRTLPEKAMETAAVLAGIQG